MTNLRLAYHFFRFRSFLFFCVIFCCISLHAQNTKNFNGIYVLNDTIEGTADLNYFLKNRDTILHGDFTFKSIQETDTNLYTSFEYQGEFKEDKKADQWYFKTKDLSLEKDYAVSDLKLQSTASGVSTEVFANFTDGNADKKWTTIKYKFENSIPEDTLYTIQTNFNKGLLEGPFVSNSKNLEVSGQFSEGFMEGKWIFDDGKHKEVRVFEQGVLTDIEVNDVNIEFIGFDTTLNDKEDWETIELNDTYFQIFNRSKIEILFSGDYLNQSELQESIKNSNSFVNNAFKSFNYTENEFSIWNNLRGSESFSLPKVKIRKFKFSNIEKKQIKSINESAKESKIIIKNFRENTMLEIGKLNFEALNKIDLVISIYNEKFENLEPTLELIQSSAFEYLKREELIRAYKVDLKFPETIAYSYDDEVVSEAYEFPRVESDNYDLNYLSELLEEILDDLKQLSEKANEDFEKLRKQESLTENEELLVKKRETIENLFDKDKNEDFNTYHEYFSNAVASFLDETISDYRKLSLDIKKSRVEEVLECMDQLIEFGEEGLIDFEDRVERVDEEYTRVVFNPFLMTDITERVKERIYNAYESVLLDHVLEKLKDNLECDNLNDNIENLKILNESMLQLREKDTRDMERDLRREKDADKILSILNIELN